MSRVVQSGLGAEEFLDDIEAVLNEGINSNLAVVYERMEQRDRARAMRRGLEYEPLEYDELDPDHFHVGWFPRLSLEEVPLVLYPYIVLAIEDMAPDPESARQDHMRVFRQALAIHSLASATEEEGSEAVYRRAIRMAEAVDLTLTSHPMTGRLLSGLPNPVRGQSSIPFTYREKGRVDQKNWFQSVGLSYAIKIYTTNLD